MIYCNRGEWVGEIDFLDSISNTRYEISKCNVENIITNKGKIYAVVYNIGSEPLFGMKVLEISNIDNKWNVTNIINHSKQKVFIRNNKYVTEDNKDVPSWGLVVQDFHDSLNYSKFDSTYSYIVDYPKKLFFDSKDNMFVLTTKYLIKRTSESIADTIANENTNSQLLSEFMAFDSKDNMIVLRKDALIKVNADLSFNVLSSIDLLKNSKEITSLAIKDDIVYIGLKNFVYKYDLRNNSEALLTKF
ncbi:MAG: hypothetical protein NTY74_16015 [Ignavibacteriae bacterium]|nr:hypothetical protein [Ignavibacteriota bacterium]